ncbi:hypothetical protein HYDPIDRAFT_122720 [Hydnomerulius pinastri MD-312]|nr:hypothetical protein HYDPIDRAFT_122720 [Hydnomerulius pinastri MD-312]
MEEDADTEFPIARLWDEFTSDHTFSRRDYFEEIQHLLEQGESLFACPIRPADDELGIETEDNDCGEQEDAEDNWGIDIQGKSCLLYVEVSPDSPTYPWTSMAVSFVTHLLFSSPRLRFSDAQKKSILSWAMALGADGVPSLYSLRKTQERIKNLLGDPTEKVTAASGNIFYLNSVSKAIAMDYANPLTRFSMQDYPEDGQGQMSQVHHGHKMLEGLPDDLAPPCVCVGTNIFFVNELLQRSTKDYFIPKKFFQAKLDGALEADILALGHGVSRTDMGYSVDPEQVIVKKSGGRMVLTVPLIVFMDDVSGNISKQWNKHHVVYMSNASMPREMLEKEFCVRFVSSSPHAAPLELIRGVKASIEKAANDGVIAWDCKLHQEVMLIPYKLFLAGDNPMQAEECSHGGLKCNYFCRTCKVGGTNIEKKSDKGYCDIFKPGELRTPIDTISEVKGQIDLAKQSGGTEKVKTAISKSGIRDAASAAIVDLDDIINPLLGMAGLDIHQDTPTEILHTILLGVVKYYWGQTVYILDKAHLLGTFQTRLDSIDKDGLNSPTLGADYIVRFKGILDGWTVIGELVVLLWHTEIEDVEVYLASLSRTIEDFLSISAQCAPSILFTKAKFHFLLHLPMFIRRFGPAILFSTERFESFNHVFRLASIYSNRHAPSRDTCKVFSEQDTVKHIVSAGTDIHTYMEAHPEQRHLIGIPTITPKEAGECLLGRKTGKSEIIPPVEWHTTHSAAILPPSPLRNDDKDLFYKGKSFVTADGDNAHLGGHVIFELGEGNLTELAIGKVTEILIPVKRRVASQILVMHLDFLPDLHCKLHVPCLKLSEPERKVVVIPNNVLCNVNIQHDCATAMIAAVVPPEIHAQGRTVRSIDHSVVRIHAAKIAREKKATEGEVPATGNEANPVNIPELPAFDRATKKRGKGNGKDKGKEKEKTLQEKSATGVSLQTGRMVTKSRKGKRTTELPINLTILVKDILKDRLRSCLLSPNLTAYVQDLTTRVFIYAKKNLQTFKIPEAALEDPELTDEISSLISGLLTSARSGMKQKIESHTLSKSHVSVLAKSLAPGGGYEMTTAHWARIAFLRSSLVLFENVVKQSQASRTKSARGHMNSAAGVENEGDSAEGNEDEPEDNQEAAEPAGAKNKSKDKPRIWNTNNYWDYVDAVLVELRAEARAAESTPAGRAKYLEAFFTRCLQSDMKTYPATSSQPAFPAFDKVTVPWQKAIHTGLIW